MADPAPVGIFSASSGAGTSANPAVTLPASIPIGSKAAILVSSSAGAGSMTTPTGWTLESPSPILNTNVLAVRLYTKDVGPADSSTTVTFTAAAAKWTIVGGVWSDVDGDLEIVGIASAQNSSNGTSLTVPAVDTSVDAPLVVALSGYRLASATVASYTAPTGYTEQADVVGGTSPSNSAALATRQLTTGTQDTTATTATIASGQGSTFAIALQSASVDPYDAAAILATGDSHFDRRQSNDSPNTYGGPYGTDPVKAALVAEGWATGKVNTSGKSSRKIADGAVGLPITQNVIRSWRDDEGFDPGYYLDALGTNNRTEDKVTQKVEMEKVHDVIVDEAPVAGHARTIGRVGTAYPAANTTDQASVDVHRQAVKELAAARSDITVLYFDWEAFVRRQDETGLWDGDGVHMTDAGYAVREAYIAARTVDGELFYTSGTGRAAATSTATSGATHPTSGTARATGTATGSTGSTRTTAGTARAVASARASTTGAHTATGTGRATAVATGITGSVRTKTGTARATATTSAVSGGARTTSATAHAVATATGTHAAVRPTVGTAWATATATGATTTARTTTGTARAVAAATGVASQVEVHTTTGTARAVATAISTTTTTRTGVGTALARVVATAAAGTVRVSTGTGRAVAVAAAATLTTRLAVGTAPARALVTGTHNTVRINVGTGRAVATGGGSSHRLAGGRAFASDTRNATTTDDNPTGRMEVAVR